MIDEQTQNPYERAALRELTSLLSGGALEAEPRESYRDELRERLLTEASLARRRGSWFRTPLALGAAAALVMAVLAGTALRGSGFGAGGGRQMAATGSAPQPAQIAAAPMPAGGTTYGLDAGPDSAAVKALGNVEVASVPQASQSAPGQSRAATSDSTSEATAVSRGVARPEVHDSAMVKVEPGAASFTLEAKLPLVQDQISHATMASVEVGPQQLAAVAQSIDLPGNVQTGFDHLWVGAPLAGQPTPTPDLPPYKQPGHWLLAGRDWGNGWSYYLTDDRAMPGTPVTSAAEAEQAARNFLQRLGVVQPDNLAISAQFDSKSTSYWVGWQLSLNGANVRGVQGGIRVGTDGGIRYASWPAFAGLVQGGNSQLRQPDEAFGVLRTTPFDWYDPTPKLTVTQVDLAYRWPAGTEAGTAAELELVYEFTVHDADGRQAVLSVPAWRP
ncbi:MAG: hypothetical protein ACYC5Y_01695 [Symbiobacteriia bacterium]